MNRTPRSARRRANNAFAATRYATIHEICVRLRRVLHFLGCPSPESKTTLQLAHETGCCLTCLRARALQWIHEALTKHQPCCAPQLQQRSFSRATRKERVRQQRQQRTRGLNRKRRQTQRRRRIRPPRRLCRRRQRLFLHSPSLCHLHNRRRRQRPHKHRNKGRHKFPERSKAAF